MIQRNLIALHEADGPHSEKCQTRWQAGGFEREREEDLVSGSTELVVFGLKRPRVGFPFGDRLTRSTEFWASTALTGTQKLSEFC